MPTRIRVLDDVHHLATSEVHHSLRMMMCSPSTRLRLVIATRPGAARGTIAAGRAALRTAGGAPPVLGAESAQLLERNGVRLSARQIAVLPRSNRRMACGVAAGALQLQNNRDTASVIASFSGDERPVADYLVGEVLVRLLDDEREVLRTTCICDPVPARLAVELSGREDAAELLDRLEHDTGLTTGIGP